LRVVKEALLKSSSFECLTLKEAFDLKLACDV